MSAQTFKWTVVFFTCIPFSVALPNSVFRYSEAIESVAAMEFGYEQVENENGKLVWCKVEQ